MTTIVLCSEPELSSGDVVKVDGEHYRILAVRGSFYEVKRMSLWDRFCEWAIGGVERWCSDDV
jgi:hypothetical protein